QEHPTRNGCATSELNGGASRRPRCGICGRCSACRRWTKPEDDLVDELVGNVELQEIVSRLGDRFKIERTVPGLVSRLKRRGRSHWREALSLHDLERLFGVDHRAISRTWIDAGLLVGTRRTGRGPHDGWLFTADEVERFIRDCAFAYDVDPHATGSPTHTAPCSRAGRTTLA